MPHSGTCYLHSNSEKMMSTNKIESMIGNGSSPDPLEYRVFRVGDEEYGIESNKVQNLYADHQITLVADAPAFIKGSVSLDGVDVPVVDLRVLLNLQGSAADSAGNIMVLRLAGGMVGILVDSVLDPLDVGARQVTPLQQLLRH